MISRWVRRNTNIFILFICHNVLPHDGGGMLDRRLAWTVLHQASAFIVHSDQDRYRLLALLPRAHVIKTYHPTYAELAHHHDAVNTASPLAEDDMPADMPADCPILLFFGFVRPYKGLEYLIQALPLVLQQQKVHLLVVGEFWSSPTYYRHYAQEFGVEQAITFIDRYVPNEELGRYFGAADVVVLPYIAATQSGVVQLAFGFGKPVITTRVGGLHEVVQDGVNGLIVPPQDEQSLAQAIVRFCSTEIGAVLNRNVQAHAATHAFSWQALIDHIEQFGTLAQAQQRQAQP
jgi:glycosyltransferase involved in cell wall biosynthesis